MTPGVRRGEWISALAIALAGASAGACDRPATPPSAGAPRAGQPTTADAGVDAAVPAPSRDGATPQPPADAAAAVVAGVVDAAAGVADAGPRPAQVLPPGHDELIIGRAGTQRDFIWRTSAGDVAIAVDFQADDQGDDPLRVGVEVTRAGTAVWSCPAGECELDCVGCDLGLAVITRDTLWIASLSWNKARTVPEGVRRLRWSKGRMRIDEIEDPCRLAPRVLLWSEYCDELAAD